MQFACVCIVIWGKLHCLIAVQLKGFAKLDCIKTTANNSSKAHKGQSQGAPPRCPLYIRMQAQGLPKLATRPQGQGGFASLPCVVFAKQPSGKPQTLFATMAQVFRKQCQRFWVHCFCKFCRCRFCGFGLWAFCKFWVQLNRKHCQRFCWKHLCKFAGNIYARHKQTIITRKKYNHNAQKNLYFYGTSK